MQERSQRDMQRRVSEPRMNPHSARRDLTACRACVVLAAVTLVAGCDQRQQKPKTSSMSFGVIASAGAQTTDLVVPPTAVSGAMQPIDETFALFAASSGLAEVEAARLVLKSEKRSEIRAFAERMAKEH